MAVGEVNIGNSHGYYAPVRLLTAALSLALLCSSCPVAHAAPVRATPAAQLDPSEQARSLLERNRNREALALVRETIGKVSGPRPREAVGAGDWRTDLLGHALVFRELSAEQRQNIYLADMYNLQGMALFRLNQISDCEVSVRRALALNPYHGQAWNNLGVVLVKRRQYDEALAAFNKSLEINKRFADSYRNRSELYRQRKQFDLEQKDVDTYHRFRKQNLRDDVNLSLLSKFEYVYRILSKKARTPRVLTALGVVNWEESRLGESEANFEAAIKLAPRLTEAHSAYGMLLLWEKKYKEAIIELSQAIALDPTFAIPYFNRARAEAVCHRYDEAIADFSKFIELKPPSASLILNAYGRRGSCRAALRQFALAVKDFDLALSMQPPLLQKASLISNRGTCYEGLGNKEQALKDYEAALQIAPDNKSIFAQRGKIMLSMGEYEQAMVDLGTSGSTMVDDVSKEPPSAAELNKLILHYDKLIALFPKAAESLYNRGLLYLTMLDNKRGGADMQAVVGDSGDCNTTADYAACWASIALRLQNKEAEADRLLAGYSKRSRRDKPPQEVEYFWNRAIHVDVSKIARGNRERKTRALTLLGLDALAHKDRVRAREYLSAVRHDGEPSMDEFALAMAYLKRLGY